MLTDKFCGSVENSFRQCGDGDHHICFRRTDWLRHTHHYIDDAAPGRPPLAKVSHQLGAHRSLQRLTIGSHCRDNSCGAIHHYQVSVSDLHSGVSNSEHSGNTVLAGDDRCVRQRTTGLGDNTSRQGEQRGPRGVGEWAHEDLSGAQIREVLGTEDHSRPPSSLTRSRREPAQDQFVSETSIGFDGVRLRGTASTPGLLRTAPITSTLLHQVQQISIWWEDERPTHLVFIEQENILGRLQDAARHEPVGDLIDDSASLEEQFLNEIEGSFPSYMHGTLS